MRFSTKHIQSLKKVTTLRLNQFWYFLKSYAKKCQNTYDEILKT